MHGFIIAIVYHNFMLKLKYIIKKEEHKNIKINIVYIIFQVDVLNFVHSNT
jgi:hypothetical protein